jgi:hypothetical protein
MRFLRSTLVVLGLLSMTLFSVVPLEDLAETAYDESEPLPLMAIAPVAYAALPTIGAIEVVRSVRGNNRTNLNGSAARDTLNCFDGRSSGPQKLVSLLCTLIC